MFYFILLKFLLKSLQASQRTCENYIRDYIKIKWRKWAPQKILSMRKTNIRQNTLKLPGDLWSTASCLFSTFSHVELFSSKNQQHKTSITSFLNNSLHAMQHSKVTCSIRKQYFEKVLLTSPPLNYDLKAQKY